MNRPILATLMLVLSVFAATATGWAAPHAPEHHRAAAFLNNGHHHSEAQHAADREDVVSDDAACCFMAGAFCGGGWLQPFPAAAPDRFVRRQVSEPELADRAAGRTPELATPPPRV